MTRKEAKIGMVVQLAGRTGTIVKLRGDRASVRVVGESIRWRKIEDLEKAHG